MSDLNFEICDGKSFRDLCRDIINRSDSKKNQVDILYTEMRSHIKDAASALNFVPQLKGLIETGIKNDEQLVKLAAVLQKLQSAQIEATGGDNGGLSEEEKAQMLREVESIKQEVDSNIIVSMPEVNKNK